MKYSIRYYKGCPIEEADEVIIKYREKDSEIFNFIKKFRKDQRVVFNVTEVTDIELEGFIDIFRALHKKHNIAVLCSVSQDYVLFAENDIPFFFCEPVRTLDGLVWATSLDVSDIYIADELCFNLEQVSETYGGKVNIRVYPNLAQSSAQIQNNFKKFFIIPEDVDTYSNYVDIFEFVGDLETQPTFIKIYKDKKWDDDLNLIIKGLNYSILSPTIVPLFGVTRAGCGKKCAFKKCEICDHVKAVSDIMKERETYLSTEEVRKPFYLR